MIDGWHQTFLCQFTNTSIIELCHLFFRLHSFFFLARTNFMLVSQSGFTLFYYFITNDIQTLAFFLIIKTNSKKIYEFWLSNGTISAIRRIHWDFGFSRLSSFCVQGKRNIPHGIFPFRGSNNIHNMIRRSNVMLQK